MNAAESRRRKPASGDRLARVVTILAVTMAATYVAIRVVNWIRFAGF